MDTGGEKKVLMLVQNVGELYLLAEKLIERNGWMGIVFLSTRPADYLAMWEFETDKKRCLVSVHDDPRCKLIRLNLML